MKLSPAETAALARFRTFLEAYLGERLRGSVLFGSRARGEGHEDSDLDVLVLVRSPTRAERAHIFDEACAIEIETGLPFSPLVRDADSWPEASPLAIEIERDGIDA